MKIFHTADWHIDQLHEWGKRGSFTEYHISVIDKMIEEAISQKVDVFVFAGDLYKNSSSNFKTKDEINEYLIRKINELRKNNIFVIFISGNHDIRHKSTTNRANNLKLYHTIGYEDLVVNHPDADTLSYIDHKGVRFIIWPYLRNKTKGDIDGEIREKIAEFDGDSIIISHLDVFGAIYGSIEIKSLDLQDLNTWSPEELEDLGAKLVLLGHVHNHQTLGKRSRVIYSGSPYKLSYNEEGVQKGYYIHTKEEIGWISEFKDLNDKNWKTFRYDYKEKKNFQGLLEEIKKEDLEGAVVRIILEKITTEDYKYIPYKEIQDLLKDKKIFLFRGFSYKEIRNTIEIDAHKKTEEFGEALSDEKLNPRNILKRVLVGEQLEEKDIEQSLVILDGILNTLEVAQ